MTSDFAEFYAANFGRVAAQLYAYLGDRAEAQDLTQEAFCRAFDRWSRVGGYENATAWVRQVAWNLATSRLRHLQVATRHLIRQRPEHVEGPGPDRVALMRALSTLPANHRLAVVLHHVGQVSTSEIAEQCGVAEGTVRSWLSRGRAQMAEQLVDWDEARSETFRPTGTEAVVATVKRRRAVRRTAVVAVVLAVLVPLVYLVAHKPTRPPVIGPTTPPSVSTPPSPRPTVQSRPIALPGATLTGSPDVQFVDSTHAWLLEGHTFAITDDGAKTWRVIKPPALPPGSRVVMFPLDGTTAAFRVTEELADTPTNYWLTTDGGASFTSYPLNNPPAAALRAGAGRFYFRCPGATGMEDGAWGVECAQEELAKVGSGRVTPQPPLRSGTRLMNGGDGRIWLIGEPPVARLFVSDDEAKTWHELPWQGSDIQLSPDGKEVWAVTADALLELVGGKWEQRMRLSTADLRPTLLGKGIWLVTHDGGMAYLREGRFTPIPGLPTFQYAYTIGDGTLVGHLGNELYLGLGAGVDRQWIRIS